MTWYFIIFNEKYSEGTSSLVKLPQLFHQIMKVQRLCKHVQ